MKKKKLKLGNTDYNGFLPNERMNYRKMQEEMDIYCQYLTPVGTVCSKCSKLHASPIKPPMELV